MSQLLLVLLALVLFALFAGVARRLLGVRRLSATRTGVAALLGLLIGIALGWILIQRDVEADLAIVAGLALGLLATMLVIVTNEVLLGPKDPGRRLRNPVAAIRYRVEFARRSTEVTRIFSKHLGRGINVFGDTSPTPGEAAEFGIRLRGALEEAGGVFVKLGQLLATRPDLIPPEMARELSALQQDVPPVAVSEARATLEASLGRPADEAFGSFDWDPIAAASLGQVYRASLVTGEDVVVKVRRPGIEDAVARDLRIATDLVGFVEQRSARARQLGASDLMEEFAAQLLAELDYENEAQSIREATVALGSRSELVVPEVFDQLSTDRVLVLGFLHGVPLGRLDGQLGEEGRRLADALLDAELDSMLSGARFHADLHPGNVLITPEGRLGLVDFGATGRLDAFERAAVGDILAALEIKDPSMLREAALQVGMQPGDVDEAQLDRAFARLMADHLETGAEPTVALLGDFLEITQEHGLRLPTSISAMLRAVATLEGTLQILSPEYPVIPAAQDYARREVIRSLSPESLADEAKREVIRLAPLIRRAPYHLDRIASQAQRGKLTLRISLFSTEEDTRWLSRLFNRAILAFLGAAIGVVSVLLFQITGGPELTDNLTFFDLLGLVGLFGGAVLVMRVILEILREA